MEVGTGDLATVLGVGERQVQKLEKAGVLKKTAHGTWPLPESVQAYVGHRVQSELRRAGRTPANDRMADLKADKLAFQVERESRSLLREAERRTIALIDEIVAPVKPDLMAIPARLTKDISLRRRMENEIEDVFTAASKRMKKSLNEESRT